MNLGIREPGAVQRLPHGGHHVRVIQEVVLAGRGVEPCAVTGAFPGGTLEADRVVERPGEVDQTHGQQQQDGRRDGEFHQRLATLPPAMNARSTQGRHCQRHLSNRESILFGDNVEKGGFVR